MVHNRFLLIRILVVVYLILSKTSIVLVVNISYLNAYLEQACFPITPGCRDIIDIPIEFRHTMWWFDTYILVITMLKLTYPSLTSLSWEHLRLNHPNDFILYELWSSCCTLDSWNLSHNWTFVLFDRGLLTFPTTSAPRHPMLSSGVCRFHI